MSVGDVESNDRGTGARFNDGKPPVELIDLRMIVASLKVERRSEQPVKALLRLAIFQESGGRNEVALHSALQALVEDGLQEHWRHTADVLGYGARKYAPGNWCKGMPWSVPLGCAVRHLLAEIEGETFDGETGLPHRAHAICNVMFLCRYALSYPEGNDILRPTPP